MPSFNDPRSTNTFPRSGNVASVFVPLQDLYRSSFQESCWRRSISLVRARLPVSSSGSLVAAAAAVAVTSKIGVSFFFQNSKTVSFSYTPSPRKKVDCWLLFLFSDDDGEIWFFSSFTVSFPEDGVVSFVPVGEFFLIVDSFSVVKRSKKNSFFFYKTQRIPFFRFIPCLLSYVYFIPSSLVRIILYQ